MRITLAIKALKKTYLRYEKNKKRINIYVQYCKKSKISISITNQNSFHYKRTKKGTS